MLESRRSQDLLIERSNAQIILIKNATCGNVQRYTWEKPTPRVGNANATRGIFFALLQNPTL